MHLPVEMNNGVVEGLVDIGASISIMAASIIQELGIMHLVRVMRHTMQHLELLPLLWGG
jgi:hypothetical protein